MTRLLTSPLRTLVEGSLALFRNRGDPGGTGAPMAHIDRLSAQERRDIGLDAKERLFESWQRY